MVVAMADASMGADGLSYGLSVCTAAFDRDGVETRGVEFAVVYPAVSPDDGSMRYAVGFDPGFVGAVDAGDLGELAVMLRGVADALDDESRARGGQS